MQFSSSVGLRTSCSTCCKCSGWCRTARPTSRPPPSSRAWRPSTPPPTPSSTASSQQAVTQTSLAATPLNSWIKGDITNPFALEVLCLSCPGWWMLMRGPDLGRLVRRGGLLACLGRGGEGGAGAGSSSGAGHTSSSLLSSSQGGGPRGRGTGLSGWVYTLLQYNSTDQ